MSVQIVGGTHIHLPQPLVEVEEADPPWLPAGCGVDTFTTNPPPLVVLVSISQVVIYLTQLAYPVTRDRLNWLLGTGLGGRYIGATSAWVSFNSVHTSGTSDREHVNLSLPLLVGEYEDWGRLAHGTGLGCVG